jgi:hypothetical protein
MPAMVRRVVSDISSPHDFAPHQFPARGLNRVLGYLRRAVPGARQHGRHILRSRKAPYGAGHVDQGALSRQLGSHRAKPCCVWLSVE